MPVWLQVAALLVLIHFTYDALNRLSTLQEQTAAEVTASAAGRTTSYGYDLNGNIAQKTAPNGDKETYVYDALNRSTDESAQTGGNVSLFDYQYGYDLASNVLTVTETYPGGLSDRTVTNTYDAINRLLVEAVSASVNVTTTYVYDNANNRTSKAIVGGTGAGTTTYSYNNLNQLTGYTDGTRSVALTYDLDGNRATRVVSGGSDNGTDTYSYDFENRLIGLTKGTSGGVGTYAYQYDYRTRRITRDESSAGGVLTHVIFSGGASVQEIDGANTTPTVEYIRGSDYGGGVGGVLYTVRSGTPSYTHANRRGDIVAKTDSSGNLTFQNQYDGEGDQVATNGSTLDRQKDNSKDTDPTGLINEGMRYTCLENGLRLFLTRDPAGFVDGPNLYTYVRQNPWTSFDPEGLSDNNDEVDEGESPNHVEQSPAPVLEMDRVPPRGPNGEPPTDFQREVYESTDPVANYASECRCAEVDAFLPAPKTTAAANGKGRTDGSSPSRSQAETKATTDKQVSGEQPRDSKGRWTSPSEGDAPPGKSGEQKILDKKGQVKNTSSVSGDEGKSTPDYINKTQVGEIKTSKVVNDTKQMRIQRQAAKEASKDHVVDVGKNAKVSKEVERKSTVVRHDEIGPSP